MGHIYSNYTRLSINEMYSNTLYNNSNLNVAENLVELPPNQELSRGKHLADNTIVHDDTTLTHYGNALNIS